MDYKAAASYWTEKDKSAVKMDAEELKAEIEAFLAKHKVCALATAAEDFVRCTPIEYNYVDGCFYLFSEGGLKFKALESNKHVCMAIFQESADFGNLASLQVTGTAQIVEPWSEEYVKIVEFKKIPVEVLKKLPQPMNLIKIVPEVFDFLKSDLKKKGFGSRQQLKVV
ncbi:MAG: pyridoxamine 5'-phosphate oxidase family protein [Lachnospiraceae bacterium]|jgi:nitroimidazol reductase NimA-like FMN-containing flavoprotein (pyridoxamine 5'-phosphate oxidase superfamily)|nr:pyridoxamine 5'-phosphate oxidase family protein [Lachnospiraceae bacterium]MCH4030865.1 pyridoxamine 5'-phosphate oxidase family protein [Lachnospiraceae bacterium]MCH4070839.1 pyridoxamine 5'-phosphate oxidase family protein [Lachnospiraceae bacterium]MCI1302159.1 pyridoxamine 5'-phosphate oxidase family protein [Lachnospiraceae bacterium]MCI1331019.1 pyridoxamine 5'-phosphate oxidase family protein [Lachnospiraceae bacterium]